MTITSSIARYGTAQTRCLLAPPTINQVNAFNMGDCAMLDREMNPTIQEQIIQLEASLTPEIYDQHADDLESLAREISMLEFDAKEGHKHE
jgi:hypothetical protein